MAAEPSPRRFTVKDYYRMGKAGILTAEDRVELIEGEIVQMPPIGSPHASGVNRLVRSFAPRIGNTAVVSVQNPLRLSDQSEPVPDFMLLRPRDDLYAVDHPTPGEVLLLVEVSDTTLAYDRRVKLPLYAREGVPEVWVVDLNGQQLFVARDPSPTGYRTTLTLSRGDRLAPLAFPDLDLAVDDDILA